MNSFDRLVVRDPWFGPPIYWRFTEINRFNATITAALHEPKVHSRLILGAFALLYSGNPYRMKN